MKNSICPLLLFCLLSFGILLSSNGIKAQNCDCPYPIIFMHGHVDGIEGWNGVYDDPDFKNIWGAIADTFFVVLNATTQTKISGPDGVLGNNDDDVLYQFVNEDNVLNPGCVYGYDFRCFWNENSSNPIIGKNPGDPIDECSSPGFLGLDSDGNESSFFKQAYSVGVLIDRVLAANPGKDKVILIGHSAGGLAAREYLQRDTAPTASGRWWLSNEHRVAKLITVGTPHRGSNLFGNPLPSPLIPDSGEAEEGIDLTNRNMASSTEEDRGHPNNPDTPNNSRDIIPDINSELVRDIRYSYVGSSLSCSFGFGPNQGVYLFGGDESCISDGYHNDDVDGDGDENDIVLGINIDGTQQGGSNPWDGTYDQPAMPLPKDVRYTYITHDILTDNGDQVVALDRQWIFNNNVPYPLDPAQPGGYYLTDTLLGDFIHFTQQTDVYNSIRGLDEPDYPKYAYEVEPNIIYAGTTTIRSSLVGNTSQSNKLIDPDWFKIDISGTSNDTLILIPNQSLNGSVDVFLSDPGDFADLSVVAIDNASFGLNAGTVKIPLCNTDGNISYFIRITHNNIVANSWKTAYKFELKSVPDCKINSASAGIQTACTPTTDTYSQEIIVTYSNVADPNSNISVNGTLFPMTASPQSITLNNLSINSGPVDVTVSIDGHQCCSTYFPDLFSPPADTDNNNIADICDEFTLNLKVFLEGSFDPATGMMRTDLNQKNLIPLSQPYAALLIAYPGTESLSSIPSQMVDWVLVDIRTGTAINTTIDRRAALLMEDGSIKDLSGNDLTYTLNTSGNLYVVVRHRNHTDVLSSNPVPRSFNMSYDFTTGTSMAYLSYQKSISGTACMYAADISQNANIDVTDYNLWKAVSATLNTYDQRDTNMDGTVQTTDYDLWYPNRSVNAPNEVNY